MQRRLKWNFILIFQDHINTNPIFSSTVNVLLNGAYDYLLPYTYVTAVYYDWLFFKDCLPRFFLYNSDYILRLWKMHFSYIHNIPVLRQ